MPIAEGDRHMKCMATPCGTVQWKVLSMGLKNAGSQFQRMMEWVLRDIECASPYIDDVLVGSKRYVGTVYRNPFQGRMPSVGSVRRSWCATQRSRFCSTWRWSFVGTFCGRAQGNPHTQPVMCNPTSDNAFKELKTHMAEELLLFQPNPTAGFILRTDASDYAIGAVLCQKRNGSELPVGFFSRKLTGSQLNWSVNDKEMYVVMAALVRWSGDSIFSRRWCIRITKH